MKYISLFAGIGGFDLALNRLGHECVYVNEWDKYAAQTYEKNFRHKPDIRSITDISANEIPDHDLLVGGFPCQAFSVAGKRRGFEEARGTLFFDIARILKHHQTKYFILENVKGLTNHDGGRTFRVIIKTLTELGYDLQWQVCNSKNFGVPQNRERVFIIGNLRGQSRPQVFPITQSVGIFEESEREAGQAIANTLRAKQGGPDIDQTYVTRYPLKFAQRNQRSIEGDYAYTVDGANTGGIMISKTIRSGGRSSPHGSKQNWDSYDFNGVVRRLTPIECERLQGFPDDWTAGVSDTQRYKQLGNAVTVNVVYEVAKRL